MNPAIVKAQVLLDRSIVSPGVIDGFPGGNTTKAIRVFQQLNRLQPSGALDEPTWTLLTRITSDPAVATYTITQADVTGPFVQRIPTKMKAMADLKSLAYRSPRERLAERFHMDEDLLRALNPGVDFTRPGTQILVANVRRAPSGVKAALITVNKRAQSVSAFSRDGRLLAFYPATVGSGEFPSPSGERKVTAIAWNPTFTYTSRLEYSQGLKPGEGVVIPAGPNSPVGLVWIDLNKRGYGIHGSPDPEKIGKRASHGCVRLTNWDAQELAQMTEKGTTVRFE
ncbi:MAG: L,D-transpeptidase family protein [Armatimonadota bacterium]